MDLIKHDYVEEEVKTQEVSKESSDEPAAKKAKVEAEEETKMVKKSMDFVELEKALNVDWSQDTYAKRIRRMDPAYFILQILLEFQSREGCSPRAEMRSEDMKLLTSLKDSIVSKFGLPDKKIPDEILPMLFAELSPVAAIVGGVLGQEVIKVISNKDSPHNNFFLYNPLESCGVVETIGVWKIKYFTWRKKFVKSKRFIWTRFFVQKWSQLSLFPRLHWDVIIDSIDTILKVFLINMMILSLFPVIGIFERFQL